MSPTTRWCPTPEQLMMLEEMYRGGIRTPNATQIQQIAAHLSNYGRIQGKNVFYWFQNHKARDRQRLRRKQHFHDKQQQQHLLRYFASPPPPVTAIPLQHVTWYDSAATLLPPPQGGVVGAHVHDVHLSPPMNNLEEIRAHENDDSKKKMTEMEMEIRRYKRKQADWMMMMVQGPYHRTTARPLKTLELFPLTATNLGEECK